MRARSTRWASTRTPRPARAPATRTSSSCSTSRPSCRTPAATCTRCRATADFGPYPSDMTKRDAFRGPGFWNVDATLSKRFRFGDHYAVQFRFEAYNVLQPREHVRGQRHRGHRSFDASSVIGAGAPGRSAPRPASSAARPEVRVLDGPTLWPPSISGGHKPLRLRAPGSRLRGPRASRFLRSRLHGFLIPALRITWGTASAVLSV